MRFLLIFLVSSSFTMIFGMEKNPFNVPQCNAELLHQKLSDLPHNFHTIIGPAMESQCAPQIAKILTTTKGYSRQEIAFGYNTTTGRAFAHNAHPDVLLWFGKKAKGIMNPSALPQ